jgi:hypothetical protein
LVEPKYKTARDHAGRATALVTASASATAMMVSERRKGEGRPVTSRRGVEDGDHFIPERRRGRSAGGLIIVGERPPTEAGLLSLGPHNIRHVVV